MFRPEIKELKKAIIALQIIALQIYQYQEMKTGALSNAISLNDCILKQCTVSGAAGSDFGLGVSSSTPSSALESEIDSSFGAEIMEAYYSLIPMPNSQIVWFSL